MLVLTDGVRSPAELALRIQAVGDAIGICVIRWCSVNETKLLGCTCSEPRSDFHALPVPALYTLRASVERDMILEFGF